MNAWTTLISRLAVDRKPIPRIKVPKVKAPKVKRVVTSTPSGMTRKEICIKANKVLQITRKKNKDNNKERVYAEVVTPMSVEDIATSLGLSKDYVRGHLLTLIDEGRMKRYKVVLREAFSSKEVVGYHYERV